MKRSGLPRVVVPSVVLVCLALLNIVTATARGSWSRMSGMPTGRSELAVTLLDGRIYAAGGIEQWGTSDSFEALDPETGTWKRLAPLPRATHHPAMAAVGGRIYLTGGYADLFF
jgi:N-acetylneuraminic acid mutarotase